MPPFGLLCNMNLEFGIIKLFDALKLKSKIIIIILYLWKTT